MATVHANGLMSPPQTEKAASVASPPRVVLAGKTGRILCVADIRGDYHELNRLIREHDATAVIHTGDFGFINAESLDRMGDKILRHLLQYSPLIPPATRSSLLAIPATAGRAQLISALNNSSIHFPLSQFPHLLSGAITFPVPVFTVWGLIEDVRVLEKFRTGEYEVHNLSVIDEACTRVLDVSGLKLRLFGLGGAVAQHKLFDNGEGLATIAGGQGTMWTTALQIGELVDTAQRVYDSSETRLLVTSAPVSRNGMLSLLANTLKADLTISGGLHFRYPVSFNEFSCHADFEEYRQKLEHARDNFVGVYTTVKERIDSNMNEYQQALLKKAIAVAEKIPDLDTGVWTNTWNWVLSDASCGHMLLSINDGRVSAESKSSGLNFAHRVNNQSAPPSAPLAQPAPPPVAPRATTAAEPPMAKPLSATPVARPPPALPNAMPAKPVGPPAGINPPVTNIRGIATRPPVAPVRPPTGPATATPTAVPSSIPPKPMQARPRLSNGPLNPGPLPKDKPADPKPATPSRPTPPAAKPPSTAQVNGKPSSPAPRGGRNSVAEKRKDETPPNGPAKGEKADKDKKEVEKKEDKKVAKVDKDVKATSDADKKVEEEMKDGKKSPREENAPGAQKRSLYIKGLPSPTTEDELKALFPGSSDKIAAVKLITDRYTNKQKDYAYIDFVTEADCQEALKSHGDTIRDKTVSVTISNPPASRFPTSIRGGRGSFRGSRGGPRGTSFGGSAGRKDGDSPAPAGEKKEAPAAPSGGEKKD